jgi:glucose/arabinose dehydrogenase
MRPHRRIVVAIALGALLVACADDDDAATTTTNSAATSAAESDSPSTTAEPTAAGTGSEPTTTRPTTTTASTAPTAPTASTAAPTQTGNAPAVSFTELGSFDSPVDMVWREGDDAPFVVNKTGTIVRVGDDDGPTTVLDISSQVSGGGEQGLLGLAFDATGRLAYINYTDVDGNTVVEEHAVDEAGTFATEARRLLAIEQPYSNHNGGDLVFGPDGLLYIGTGDGGAGGDPERRATNPTDLLGKMLRIDPQPAGADPYTIPPDNPFVGVAGARPEIWSTGLRNPWRFSFDQATGDLWIADVGQNAIEEVDVAPATGGRDAGKGVYFGWSALEGNARYNDDVSTEGALAPFSTYEHGPGCSVSGGVRARGAAVPDLVGWYVYGDYCAGQVWALEVLGEGATMAPGRQVDLGELPAITAVVDGPDRVVYVLSQQGSIVRLDPA